jgi:2',3'-cyclic-nucleotide 2'-phosphodiesterase (5'-nucleotidase family)
MKLHFLLALLGYAVGKPIDKSCIQHPKIQNRVEPCLNPQVPERIPNIAKFIAQTSSWSSDLCSMVAMALLGEYEMMDVVLLEAGLCHTDLEAGPLTRDKLSRVFPFDQQLVILQLNGSNLASALEHGIDQFHFHELPEAYPRVAGIQFHVDLSRPYGQRVSDIDILHHGCRWERIISDKTYLVLTNEDIARGGYDYSALARYQSLTPIRHTVAEAFWTYSETVCDVVDPMRRKTHQAATQSCASPAINRNMTSSTSLA